MTTLGTIDEHARHEDRAISRDSAANHDRCPEAPALRVTVVIPTYLRPTWLVGCMKSLLAQTRLPDEVIAVMRDDDTATHEAFDRFLSSQNPAPSEGNSISIRHAMVSEPGFLAPIAAGIKSATGDVVAFIDDDAEAYPDWLERLLALYKDPTVVGVGGRYVNIYGGMEARYPTAKRVGRFHWWGSFEGNMYRDLPTSEPREVDFFIGGNMSYRREALQCVRIDAALANDVAFHYEVDLGQQVKQSGGQLIYDPLARIRHYSAPRAQAGMRDPDRDTICWYSHNTLYLAMKHSGAVQRWLALVYSFAIGQSRAWGVLAAATSVFRRRNAQALRELKPALRGKLQAIRSFRQRLTEVSE
jgi:GT2 family glycosyltransferase